jgi:predicted dehydrogenase
MVEQVLGLGIVGYGHFGEFTGDVYADIPGVRIAGVVDSDTQRRQLAVSHLGARAYEHIAELLLDPSIDIVVLNTPPWLHGQQALAAARAGKHLFIEKPMATSNEEADELVRLAAERNLQISVDYVMRHVPLYDRLRALVDSELFGAITHIALENNASNEALGPDHWFWDHAKSGGILVEHGVHFFDLCSQLTGNQANSVTGYGHTAADGRQDRVLAAVRYANGILGMFYHAFDRRAIVERTVLRVTFERGSAAAYGWIPERLEIEGIVTHDTKEKLAALLGTTLTTEERAAPPGVPGGTDGLIGHTILVRPDRTADYAAAVRAGMEDVIRAIREPGRPPQVTAENGRASLQLALAAQQAIDSGHAVAVPRTDLDARN